MTALLSLLDKIKEVSVTQRDKGTSFENLMVQYFLNEPKYAEIYTDVLSYSDWVEKYGEKLNITDKRDYGIDLVAVTIEGDFHPIQCKNGYLHFKVGFFLNLALFFNLPNSNFCNLRLNYLN